MASQAEAKFKALKAEWGKANKDVATIGQLITAFKEAVIMVPEGERGSATMLTAQQEVLEMAVQLAAYKGDVAAFANQMAQLEASYELAATSPHLAKVGESPNKLHMQGLNLMALLCQNKTSDFHMKLAPIPLKDQVESPYINWPVMLEQSLMVGAYKRIFDAKGNLPSPFFGAFYEQLLGTVREEIAACFEAAYEKGLSQTEAARLLFLEGSLAPKELEAMCKRRGWSVSGGRVGFGKGGKKEEDPLVVAHKHATNLLAYAREIEKIP